MGMSNNKFGRSLRFKHFWSGKNCFKFHTWSNCENGLWHNTPYWDRRTTLPIHYLAQIWLCVALHVLQYILLTQTITQYTNYMVYSQEQWIYQNRTFIILNFVYQYLTVFYLGQYVSIIHIHIYIMSHYHKYSTSTYEPKATRTPEKPSINIQNQTNCEQKME